jgi:hypothetical protein
MFICFLLCPFNVEVHEIMDILNKLDGDGDLTSIVPEDMEQTVGERRD